MSIITPIGGVSTCTCDGTDWYLVHLSSVLHFNGQHVGQITAGAAVIEEFNTEAEMITRAGVLGITLE